MIEQLIEKTLKNHPSVEAKIFAHALMIEVLKSNLNQQPEVSAKPISKKRYFSKWQGGTIDKICLVCNQSFLGTPLQKMCSEDCAKLRQSERDAMRHQKLRENAASKIPPVLNQDGTYYTK